MTRKLTLLLVVAVPVLLLVNAFQAYRYSQLEREIDDLQITQQALIEENKRAILAISVLASPQRIGALAEEELGLVRVENSDTPRTETDTTGGGR